ncbi:MAG: TIGR03617 family F420-dependent LLM class oxidoreductase [Acidimicrobiales bacterium]
MEIDTGTSDRLSSLDRIAQTAEELGYAGVWAHESSHDPFLQCLRLGMASSSIRIGTAVSIAFARNPMEVAYSAYDLAEYCRGRFLLGLGSQVKAHIERRFDMPWSSPAKRMGEFVDALKAIWLAWESGDRLDFQGEFYSHTLMPPGFAPKRHDFGPPDVYVAAVGQQMARTAGRVADGVLFHAFNSPRYLSEVLIPEVDKGADQRERNTRPVVAGSVWLAVGNTESELLKAREKARAEIAFHASTPAYRGVLAVHGHESVQPQLAALAKAGRWKEMPDLIDDELVSAFAVTGDAESVGRELQARYSHIADRVIVAPLTPVAKDDWPHLLQAAGHLRGASSVELSGA